MDWPALGITHILRFSAYQYRHDKEIIPAKFIAQKTDVV